MREHKEIFVRHKLIIGYSVSELELRAAGGTDPQNALIEVSMPLGRLDPEAQHPDAEIVAYMSPDSFLWVLEAIRRELTVRLLNLIERAGAV